MHDFPKGMVRLARRKTQRQRQRSKSRLTNRALSALGRFGDGTKQRDRKQAQYWASVAGVKIEGAAA